MKYLINYLLPELKEIKQELEQSLETILRHKEEGGYYSIDSKLDKVRSDIASLEDEISAREGA